MAKKGQKFDKHSKELKGLILEDLLNGESSRYLARKYNIPRGTISNWQMQLKYPEKYCAKGLKRDRDFTKEDYKERYEILKKYQAFLKAQREKK